MYLSTPNSHTFLGQNSSSQPSFSHRWSQLGLRGTARLVTLLNLSKHRQLQLYSVTTPLRHSSPWHSSTCHECIPPRPNSHHALSQFCLHSFDHDTPVLFLTFLLPFNKHMLVLVSLFIPPSSAQYLPDTALTITHLPVMFTCLSLFCLSLLRHLEGTGKMYV